VCDLTSRPLEFANRHVRVVGTIRAGLETFTLLDDRCQEAGGFAVWLDEPEPEAYAFARGWPAKRFIAALKAGQLTGDGPSVQWQTPAALSQFDPKQDKALDRALGKANEVRAIVTGRYDYAGDGLLIRSAEGHFSQQSAYGHLNCCPGRIVLEAVELTREAK
jgi:hypothetical protein